MKKTALLFFVALAGMSACRENSSSPNGSGTIAGRVILFDSTGAVLTDYSGIQVSIDGTSNLMITDSTGDWEFSNLSDGIYDVTATKPSFGTFHWYEQNVNGGRLDESTVAIAEMPLFTPRISMANFPGQELVVYIAGADSGGIPTGTTIAGYCDLDSTIQPSAPHLMVSTSTETSNEGDIDFSYYDLLAAGVRPGQKLYLTTSNVFVSYYVGTGFQSTFVDPSHNAEVRFASTGPRSNVVAFTMP